MLSKTPAKLMCGHHADPVLSILKKAIPDFEVFMMKRFLELHRAALSTPRFNQAPTSSVSSVFRAPSCSFVDLQIYSSSHVISVIGF